MFDDIANAFRSTFYERISSPFVSSFAISWCIFNYKVIVILFSSLEVRYKFYEIELVYLKSNWDWFGIQFSPNCFLYPLLAALFYTLLFPFIEAGLIFVWLHGQRIIKSYKVRIEDITPVTQEKYNQARKLNVEQGISYLDSMDRKNIEIDEIKKAMQKQEIVLNETINQRDELISELKENLQKTINEFKDCEALNRRLVLDDTTKDNEITDLKSRLSQGKPSFWNVRINKPNGEDVTPSTVEDVILWYIHSSKDYQISYDSLMKMLLLQYNTKTIGNAVDRLLNNGKILRKSIQSEDFLTLTVYSINRFDNTIIKRV